MSDHGVYGGEMARRRLSDQEVEMLLSGEIPENDELARLAAVLHGMQASHSHVPTDEAIYLFASQASRIATDTLPTGAPTVSPRRISSVFSSRRFAATAAGLALVLGMSGVAAASNGAAPGHPLYGVDRTLESIGIGAGGATERIAEARVLLDRGQVANAVAHAAEAVRGNPTDGDDSSLESQASGELLDAAETLAEENGEPGEIRQAVSAMLTEMAAMIESGEVEGAEFGRRVSELARSLHGQSDAEPSTTDPQPGDGEEGNGQGQGPPDEVPANPPQTPGSGAPSGGNGPGGNGPPGAGGQSGGVGPPGGNGPSGGNGPPGGKGPPDRGGPPQGP